MVDGDSCVGNVNSNDGQLNLNRSNGNANPNDGVGVSMRQNCPIYCCVLLRQPPSIRLISTTLACN